MRFFTLLAFIFFVGNTLAVKKGQTPPGTVQIEENLFYDRTELSNFSWLEYVHWHKNRYGEKSEQYLNTLPDTTVWGQQANLATTYFRHPAYRNYPIVGISYEQAVDFCQWRTNMVNTFYYIHENKLTYNRDSTYTNVPVYVSYRLPTAEEWDKVAAIPVKKKGRKHRNKKAHQLPGDITYPHSVYDNVPNQLKIYQLNNNVAEMTDQKGVCKGKTAILAADGQSFNPVNYTGKATWLGFRCVCERRIP